MDKLQNLTVMYCFTCFLLGTQHFWLKMSSVTCRSALRRLPMIKSVGVLMLAGFHRVSDRGACCTGSLLRA